MQNRKVYVGEQYLCRVNSTEVTVEVVEVLPHVQGRVKVRNLATGRIVTRLISELGNCLVAKGPAPEKTKPVEDKQDIADSTSNTGLLLRRDEQSHPPTPATKLGKLLPPTPRAKPSNLGGKPQPMPMPGSQPSAAGSTASAVVSPAVVPASKATSPLAARLNANQQAANSPAPPHLIITARAGTGKTTTLVSGLAYMRGLPTNLTPSPQQQAIWQALALSSQAHTVCFVAFNKSIATELQQRVPQGCNAMTMHSLGLKACRKAFPHLGEPNSYRTQDILSELLEVDVRELRRYDPVLVSATERLVGLCKGNLLFTGSNGSLDFANQLEELEMLVAYFEIDMEGTNKDKVFDLVPQVLERCLDVGSDRGIDFNDMIWLPVVHNLPMFRYDLLLVDEAQDLNRCQQELAKRSGKRLVFCGDPKQAIYGFTGADCKSLERLAEDLSASGGCTTLPLTVTRRCGKAIVAEAKRLVPDFEAHDSNPPGSIARSKYYGPNKGLTEGSYRPTVQDGDFILCRCNAPLVSECFRFLKAGRKANIQGRDIGRGLVNLVEKLKAASVPDLCGKITDWLYKELANEQAKRNPSDNRLIALQDKADCLLCFCEGCESVEQVTRKIDMVFTDDKVSPGIKLSSIHKSKGLEAKRVYLLQLEGAKVPHPMAATPWARNQELNLLYVAITRAINELIYVTE